MKLPDLPFTVTDWASVPAVEHPGEKGTSSWRTFKLPPGTTGAKLFVVD